MRLCRPALMFAILALPSTALGQTPKDYTNYKLQEPLPSVRKDIKSEFLVNGKNDTKLIRGLTSINGVTLEKLHTAMRPAANSTAGFLGKDENLLDVLAMDNDYVLDTLKLTHQDLGKHLWILGEIADNWSKEVLEKAERDKANPDDTAKKLADGFGPILYHGRQYKLAMKIFKGRVISPFRDETSANQEVTLHNLKNDKKIWYSRIIPHMVYQYGFYEGKGTRFRLDPRDIMEALDFLKK